MKIMFACGGTAGHINPAISVADLLKRNLPDLSILFVGTPGGMENRLVKGAGYEIRHIPVMGFRRSLSPRNLYAGVSLFRSFGAAKKILREETPALVVGTGGYVCYPILRIAASKRIPVVLHESNAKAGIAARLLSRHTDLALVNFPSAARDFRLAKRTVVSGNPLRHEFYTLTREAARRRLGIPPDRLSLLVFGGSLGAAKLNETVESVVPRLLAAYPNLTILHAIGKNKGEGEPIRSYGRYKRQTYIDDMPTQLTAADLVVCRAGAMTISEIAAAGVPAILVPYPAAAGDHQTKNAKELSEKNAAVLLSDAVLTSDSLTDALTDLLSDRKKREEMSKEVSRFRVPDSEAIILREILSLCPRLVSGN